ncbi:MAG: hypothetical protein PUK48_01335 [Spirochaetales bacterium]|nr:hypothetical protein [Spirochaetales bacterium]
MLSHINKKYFSKHEGLLKKAQHYLDSVDEDVATDESSLDEAIDSTETATTEMLESEETIEITEPAVDDVAAEEPAVDEVVAEEPNSEEPAVDDVAAEEPAVGDVIAEEPAVDEIAAEEPAVDEIAAEESAIVEEPAVGEIAAEEPAVVEESVTDDEIDDSTTSEMFKNSQWDNSINNDEESVIEESKECEEPIVESCDEKLEDNIEISNENLIDENKDDEIDDSTTSEMFKNSQWDNSVNNDEEIVVENPETTSEQQENVSEKIDSTFNDVSSKFTNTCQNMQIEKAGIFEFKENECKLSVSYNVNDKDFRSGECTKEFWDENLTNYAWQVLEGEDVAIYSPIFSDDVFENICNIALKRFSFSGQNFIFFAINCNFEDYATIDIEDEIYALKASLVNLAKLTESTSSNIEKDKIKSHIINTFDLGSSVIFSIDYSNVNSDESISETNRNAFKNLLSKEMNKLFPLPNVVYVTDNDIKVVYFCKYSVDVEALEFHVKNDLTASLGQSSFKDLQFSDFHVTDVMDEVLHFVLG